MADVRNHIEHFRASTARNGVAAAIESTYNGARDEMLRETGQGFMSLLTSGFGKAALSFAALAVAGGALLFGGLAANGSIDVIKEIAPGFLQKAGQVSFAEGALGGAKIGLNFLTSGFGIASTLGIGLAGAAVQWRDQKKEVAAGMQHAQQRAAMKEMEMQARNRTPDLSAARHQGAAHQPGDLAQEPEEIAKKTDHFGFAGDANEQLGTIDQIGSMEWRKEMERRQSEARDRGIG